MADFRINVIVDPSRVPAGTRVVERSLTRVENRADLLRTTLRRTFGFLAGGAAIIGAVRSIAQFEESIATARAVTRATGEEFELLRDRALELGATTRFSATQAADALVNLSRAGFSVSEAIGSVDDTLKLAQAAGLGLAEASDITASTLRGFGLAVDQAERVTDVLTETANRANTNVSQLGEGIKFVAPVAAALGQSIEQTSAALGVLSDAGLKATLAGTGLRRVLAELAAPGEKLQSVLQSLGLTFDDINPNTNDLADVLQRLESVGNDAGLALEVFGQRGGPAFLNLVRNVPRIRELNEQLENSGGTASQVAGILDNTLNGALFRARSALDALVQSFGIAGGSDFLIHTLDGISAALRVLADNIEIVTNVTLALAAVIGLRTLGAAIIASQAALRTFALTMVLFRGSVLAATAAVIKMNVATLANPWLAAAAAITVTVVALKEYIADLNQAGKILERVEEDAKNSFNSQGTAIRQAQQEINKMNRLRERQGFLSESQQARIEALTRAIDAEKDSVRENADRQKEINEARQRGAVTLENLLAKLDSQAEALKSINRENEIRVATEEEIDRLLQAGQRVDPAAREEIENRIRRNQALADQRKLLDEIKGPQEQFARDEAALNGLMERGAITANEFKVKLEELKDSLGGVVADDVGLDLSPDQNSLDRLREQVELAELAARQGEFVAAATALENQLRREGVEITREVQDQIANLLLREQELTEEKRKQLEIEREAERAARREARELNRLEQRINGTAALADEQRRLNQLYNEGRITAEQLAAANDDIRLRGLEASNELSAGFERAFIKLRQEAEDLAAVGEKIVNVFADRATEALVEFATTGKFSFKEFASAILQDLIRIIARLLIVQALSALIPGAGAAGGASTLVNAGAALAGQRQRGGTMQPGRSYLVGENGPEIATVGQTTGVQPLNQAPAQPEVNVQVVNVQSEDEIPRAINDGNADEAIVNALARNKDRVRQVIQ